MEKENIFKASRILIKSTRLMGVTYASLCVIDIVLYLLEINLHSLLSILSGVGLLTIVHYMICVKAFSLCKTNYMLYAYTFVVMLSMEVAMNCNVNIPKTMWTFLAIVGCLLIAYTIFKRYCLAKALRLIANHMDKI